MPKLSRELRAEVNDLQAQVEAKEAELEKFKFDEELKRQQRIKPDCCSHSRSTRQLLT